MSILVTGAAGQIGTELLIELRRRYGNDNVIGVGRKTKPSPIIENTCPGPFHMGINILDRKEVDKLLDRYPTLTQIYHLAAILSGTGEQNPQLCWRVNMDGTMNILESARAHGISKILIPSSIGAFGSNAPRQAPQETAMNPSTMYGVTKVAGELLGNYYTMKYDMDCRGLRLPGIISAEAMPGGGTTDYSVEIFYEALKNGHYTSYIGADTAMPMMYMPDCIYSMIALMEADGKRLIHHCDFNVTAYSFTPRQLANCIRKYIPNFTIDYKPDFRQRIAESWPDNMIDDAARNEWDWAPKYSLDAMVKDMIAILSDRKSKTGSLYPGPPPSIKSKL